MHEIDLRSSVIREDTMRNVGLYGGIAPASTVEPMPEASTAQSLDELGTHQAPRFDTDERAAYAAAYGCREDEVNDYC